MISGPSLHTLREQQAVLVADPRVGDVVIATVKQDPDITGSWRRTAFKIARVDGTFIYARRSGEMKPGDRQKLTDMPEVAETFNLADSRFSGEPERFSRSMYSRETGPPYLLQDVSVPPKDRQRGISVDFVIRPKAQ